MMMPLKSKTSRSIIRSFLLILFIFIVRLNAQNNEETLDEIVGIVGENIILKSELDAQRIQMAASGYTITPDMECELFEELLFQKLLLNQAQLDSVEISDAQIQGEINRRLRYFVAQIGSEEKLEAYYNKSIAQIKEDFYDLIKEQLLIQQMQSKITAEVKVTPADVRAYYNRIPKDSLPYIDSEIRVAQIVKKPPISTSEKERVKARLSEFLDRVKSGEDFSTLAVLYSEDPGSAKKRGELGYMSRNELVPEFAAVAFNLKPGEVSDIVESEYGYHIIQMIGRRGEQVNVRHILLIPKVSPDDLLKAKQYLDSITTLIETVDTLTFELAASLFSDDKQSKRNSGLMVNPQTGANKFEIQLLGQMDPTLFFHIEKLEVGQKTAPILMQGQEGQAYRIAKLVERTEPHRANLKDDYQKIQDVALLEKQNTFVMDWVARKAKTSFVKLEDSYKGCNFENNWNLYEK